MSIQSLLGSHSAVVFTIRATATVKSAAEQMRQHGIAALAVKSDDVFKGLISDRDILCAVSRRGGRNLPCGVGGDEPCTGHGFPDDSLKRAMNLMVHHRLRDLPVMADGKVVGVVNMSDVAKYRLEDLETESNVLRDAYIVLAVAKPTS